jgi:hypothetical protein
MINPDPTPNAVPVVTAIHQEQTAANGLTEAECSDTKKTSAPHSQPKNDVSLKPPMRTTDWGFQVPTKNSELNGDNAFDLKSGRITLEEFLTHIDSLPPTNPIDGVHEPQISTSAVCQLESLQELHYPATGTCELPPNNETASPKEKNVLKTGTALQEITQKSNPVGDSELINGMQTDQVDFRSSASQAHDPTTFKETQADDSGGNKSEPTPKNGRRSIT